MTADWLTTRQVAQRLGVTPRRVLQLCGARGVVGWRVGRAWLWPPETPARCKPGPVGRPRRQ